MARTTAYPASIIAQLMLDKVIKEKGVVPPEKTVTNAELFRKIINKLEKRSVTIKPDKTTD
jgi:saccharopine dehydrogenase-like NADP-dependent oxidoreductase